MCEMACSIFVSFLDGIWLLLFVVEESLLLSLHAVLFCYLLQGFRLLLWQVIANGANMSESGFKVDPSSVNALKDPKKRLTSEHFFDLL